MSWWQSFHKVEQNEKKRVTEQGRMDAQEVLFEAGAVRMKLRCLLYEKDYLRIKGEQVSVF